MSYIVSSRICMSLLVAYLVVFPLRDEVLYEAGQAYAAFDVV